VKGIIGGKCARSPNRTTAGNENVRLDNGVFEGGRGVVDLAMRLELVDEGIDMGLRKSKRHSVENSTRGDRRTLRSEAEGSKPLQL